MAVIRPAGFLQGAVYFPFISAPTLMKNRQVLSFAGVALAAFTRPLEQGEEIEWIRVGRAPNGVVVLDPGPFEAEDVEDKTLELLLIEEFERGRRDNYLVVEGPRLAVARLNGYRWRRVSLALAPAGWAQDVAVRFQPGKDSLRQVFSLPQAT